MDLGTVGKKLKSFSYSSKAEFLSDLELIWSNCFQFNVIEGNIYVVYAQQMKAKLESLRDKIPEISVHEKAEIEETPFTEISLDPLPVEPNLEETIEEKMEEIEEIILDEDDRLNLFRSKFFEKRMQYLKEQKTALSKIGEWDCLKRSAKKMEEYLLKKDKSDFFPEYECIFNSIPSPPWSPQLDRTRF